MSAATAGPHSPQRNKGKKAEDREQKLCCGLDEDVDDHAGRRERAWNGVQRQQARADEIAADLRQRQQDIGRFANEPQQDARAKLRTHLRGEQQPPSHPRHGNGDRARQHHEQNAPTYA